CSKHAIPALRRSGGGAIVNLSSVSGLVGSEDFDTHAYAASKGGIVALTRAMAVAYAREGIRCNVICPGLIHTPMRQRARSDPRHADRHHLEQRVERPDAARGLDLDVRTDRAAHQLQVLDRGAAGREPGRRLDEGGAGLLREAACELLLRIVEVRVLEDDL